jgi:predicted O-methyltransferase YrrM
MIGSMQHIRPYKIFTLIEASPTERLLSLPIPSRRGTGGTSLLETFLILAGMRVVEARRIFEFGTFLGINTLNLALNSPGDAQIFTLDLDEHHAATANQVAADAPLTQIHLAAQSALDFAGTPVALK